MLTPDSWQHAEWVELLMMDVTTFSDGLTELLIFDKATKLLSLWIILSIVFLINRLVVCSMKWQELLKMSISVSKVQEDIIKCCVLSTAYYGPDIDFCSRFASCSLICCCPVCFAAIWMETTWQSSPRQTSLVSNTSESCKSQPHSLIQLRARLNMYIYNWDQQSQQFRHFTSCFFVLFFSFFSF